MEVLRRLRRASLAALRKEIEPAEQRRLAAFLPAWQGVDRHPGAGAGVDRLREVLVPLQGLALPVEVWERDVLPRRVGAYSQSWMDSLCASGELVWVGAGASGRSGRVALYFREDAGVIGPPNHPARGGQGRARAPDGVEHELLRACLAHGPSFFTDLLTACAREGERIVPGGDAPAEALREALWDLVWAGEVTNDAWAPLRAPRLSLARSQPGAAWGRLTLTGTGGDGRSPRIGRATIGRSPGGTRPRFAGRRRGGDRAGAGALVAHRARLPRRGE